MNTIFSVLAILLLQVGSAAGQDCSNFDYEANCPANAVDPANDAEKACCFITPFLTRISSQETFEAYQTQTITDQSTQKDVEGVLVIDVRTPEELYWTGQAAQVNKINLKNGKSLLPINYQTIIETTRYAPYLKLQLDKGYMNGRTRIPIKQINGLEISPIAFHIPVEFIDPTTGESTLNQNFGAQVIEIVEKFNPKALIFYCRSGQRTSIGCYFGYCSELLSLDGKVLTYEVEKTDGTTFGEINGNGGFEGSSYGNRYNGYRGFPGRLTREDEDKAVDFKDTGLPIIIGKTPNTLTSNDNWELPYACTEGSSTSPVCEVSFD